MEQNFFHMGPLVTPKAATAPKFWNVASVNEDEGEITLYGDVVSRQPTDWYTGEPEPGLYITPEGFLEDLETVKHKARIAVKLNSCGGDLYTGIAIHNALKELRGEVNVVVEGIAASAASVIMCAGDTVTVYPGSLVMIHSVSVLLLDAVNIQDLKQIIKGMDASERAVAEIYNSKTGIATDTLRSMMSKETWFTGREALEKGFADVLKEDGATSEMRLSADKKILFVNGVRHSTTGFHNIPGTIPVMRPAAKTPPPKAAIPNGGKHLMTLEELRAQQPELVAQIEQNAQTEAVSAERARLADIDSIAASIPNQQLIQDAKYGDKPCTAQELCFRVMQQSASAGQTFLANYQADGQASGAGAVGAAPNGGTPDNKEDEKAQVDAIIGLFNQTRGGKHE